MLFSGCTNFLPCDKKNAAVQFELHGGIFQCDVQTFSVRNFSTASMAAASSPPSAVTVMVSP